MEGPTEGNEILEGYKRVPTTVKTQEGEILEAKNEFREPRGELLANIDSIEILAPQNTDFPIESGFHIQVVDRSLTTHTLEETPLLSRDAEVRKILKTIAVGAIVEQTVVEKTDDVWANLNFHSRPPMTSENPIDAQYDSLTVDIHGRNINEPRNWARPPPTHGSWGTEHESILEEDIQTLKEGVDEKGQIIPATPEEIEAFRKDPMQRVWGESPTDPANPEHFHEWQNHPTGMYDWEGGRRSYNQNELVSLHDIFSSEDFAKGIEQLRQIELFTDRNPQEQYFEPNDSDVELWKFNGFQLVTQTIPLVDASQGIHMVLKLRPEPHTPWENLRQTLEAYSIGIEVARLLKNTQSLGEIGDLYLDMNANWSMTRKRDLKNMPTDEIKKRVQEDTRAHLHIQGEKMNSVWEIPPAPGTFTHHRPQSETAIEEIRGILNQEKGGLKDRIFANCSGKVFEQTQEPTESKALS